MQTTPFPVVCHKNVNNNQKSKYYVQAVITGYTLNAMAHP